MSEQIVESSPLRTSANIGALAAALAAAQGEMEPAPKDSVNPHFKSRYADLASCVRVAGPVLAKHGLAVVQAPLVDTATGMVGLVTRLLHKSGEWIESDYWCKPRDLSPQSVGASITYLRRYAYCAMTGLVSDDDDAESAQPSHGHGDRRESRRDAPPPREPEQRRAAPRQGSPAGAPPANDKPAEASIYTGTSEQAQQIEKILEKRKVPKALWPEIDEQLRGKPSTALWDIIPAVQQRAAEVRALS